MPERDLAASLVECFGNDSVVASLRSMLAPIISEAVETAVAAAVAAKDAEIKTLREDLRNVTSQLNDLEQYSRRMCVNISGIPETTNEDAKQLVLDLSGITGAQLEPTDVDVAHRIGRPRPGKTRTIIARFSTLAKRQAFYNARRELREAEVRARAAPGSRLTGEVLQKTYISDNLTQHNELLMYQARQLRKKEKLFAVWSDQGKLKLKEKKGASTKIFKSVDDLRKLCGKDPVLDEPPAAGRQPESSDDASGFSTVATRRGRSGKNAPNK